MTNRVSVFLSHSSVDKPLARRLGEDLRSANVKVWFDQWEIGVGEEFGPKIMQGLEESDFVIILLTRASVSEAAEWVDKEWRHKREHEERTKRVAVIPVRGEPCEIPDFLGQRTCADISGGSYSLGLRQLLMILRHYSDSASIEIRPFAGSRYDSAPVMIPVVFPIVVEVGKDLVSIFEPDDHGVCRGLDELAPAMCRALEAEFGFPFPGVRVFGNDTDMPPRCAVILIDEVPEVMFEVVGPDNLLVDAAVERLAALGIQAVPHDDPATGASYCRIAAANRDAADAKGLVTWDSGEYLFVELHAVIRRMASSFLDIDMTHHLVDSLVGTARDRAAQIVPKVVSWFELTDVLRHLADEQICIANLECILEALFQPEDDANDTTALAERTRHALRREITGKFSQGRDSLSVLEMASEIEDLIRSAICHTPTGSYLSLDPQLTEDILAAIRSQVSSLASGGTGIPILVTATEVRRFIRNLVSLEFPSLDVLSRQDLEPDVHIKIVGCIRLDGTSGNAPTATQGVV